MRKIISLMLVFSIFTAFSQDEGLPKAGSSTKIVSDAFFGIDAKIVEDCDAFFGALSRSEIDGAYRTLLKNSPISRKKEEIDGLIRETKRSITLYGQITGYEPVSAEKVSESMARLRFIGLNEKYPMRWIITFYKSPKYGWIVINVKFDDLSEFFFSDD